MNDTFINIGKIIRNDEVGRSKNHPLIRKQKLVNTTKKKNGEIIKKPIDNIHVFSLFVDLDNETLKINPSKDTIPDHVFKFLLVPSSGHEPYLMGDWVFKINGKKTIENTILKQISYENFKTHHIKNYKNGLTHDGIIIKFRKILDLNSNNIIDVLNDYINSSEEESINNIAFITEIKYGNRKGNVKIFSEFLDEIDEMFIISSKKGDIYTFENSFLSMFNYLKFRDKDGKNRLFPDESIPSFDKETFLNIFYSKEIYDRINYIIMGGDYGISLYPNYDNLTYYELEKLQKISKNIFNFHNLMMELDSFIDSKKYKIIKEKKLIPINLKFDQIFKVKGKNWSNFLYVTGIRYVQLKKLHDKLKSAYEKSFSDKDFNKLNIYYKISNLFIDINGNNDKYKSQIIKMLQNIYLDKFILPKTAQFCLIELIQHKINTNGDYINYTWNENYNTYKLLKHMENNNSTVFESPQSHELGFELSKMDNGHFWNDKSNLNKTVKRFAGTLQRGVRKLSDIKKYQVNILERMIRNDEYIPNTKNFDDIFKSMSNESFNPFDFYCGYYEYKFSRENEKYTITSNKTE